MTPALLLRNPLMERLHRRFVQQQLAQLSGQTPEAAVGLSGSRDGGVAEAVLPAAAAAAAEAPLAVAATLGQEGSLSPTAQGDKGSGGGDKGGGGRMLKAAGAGWRGMASSGMPGPRDGPV